MPLAAARAGLVHVPVNPALRRAQVAHILADSGAALLVTQASRAATLGQSVTGRLGWQAAQNLAQSLNVHGLTGWRLPTTRPVNGAGFVFGTSYDGSTDVGWNITSPGSELAHLYNVTLGNIAWMRGDTRAAEEYYRQAVRTEPEFFIAGAARPALFWFLARTGHPEAQVMADRAAARLPVSTATIALA